MADSETIEAFEAWYRGLSLDDRKVVRAYIEGLGKNIEKSVLETTLA